MIIYLSTSLTGDATPPFPYYPKYIMFLPLFTHRTEKNRTHYAEQSVPERLLGYPENVL
jgi:hypothetical protein